MICKLLSVDEIEVKQSQRKPGRSQPSLSQFKNTVHLNSVSQYSEVFIKYKDSRTCTLHYLEMRTENHHIGKLSCNYDVQEDSRTLSRILHLEDCHEMCSY